MSLGNLAGKLLKYKKARTLQLLRLASYKLPVLFATMLRIGVVSVDFGVKRCTRSNLIPSTTSCAILSFWVIKSRSLDSTCTGVSLTSSVILANIRLLRMDCDCKYSKSSCIEIFFFCKRVISSRAITQYCPPCHLFGSFFDQYF